MTNANQERRKDPNRARYIPKTAVVYQFNNGTTYYGSFLYAVGRTMKAKKVEAHTRELAEVRLKRAAACVFGEEAASMMQIRDKV